MVFQTPYECCRPRSCRRSRPRSRSAGVRTSHTLSFSSRCKQCPIVQQSLKGKLRVQVSIVPFPTWCDCSRSLSHRGFSHSPIICCWTLSPRPLSTGVIKINLNSEFFSFSVLPCRPHRWRHTSRHTSPPPSHHHQLIFSIGGRGGKNKLSTFL